MYNVPWHPRVRHLLLAAAVLPLLTAASCQDTGTTTTGTSSSRSCAGYERTPPWCRDTQAQPASRSKPKAASEKWSSEQLANARLIVDVGRQRGVPRRGHVVALAAAMQESSLRNPGHLGARNDHDSLGLFQQRPSQGWGTPAQVRDPRYATNKFYDKLTQVTGWQQMPVWAAAQAVQVSAFPFAYDKWVNEAERLAG